MTDTRIDEKVEALAQAMLTAFPDPETKRSSAGHLMVDVEDFVSLSLTAIAEAAIKAREDAGFVEVPRVLTYEKMNAYPVGGPSLYLLAHYASSQCNSHEENMKSVNDAFAAMIAKAT